MPRGRPPITDPVIVELVLKLDALGFSLRRIAETLEREGHINTKGRRYDAKQIARIIERGPL